MDASNTKPIPSVGLGKDGGLYQTAMRAVESRKDEGFTTVRLLCPICNTTNGTWRLNFPVLYKSKTKVRRRKRHKNCRVRLLYQAVPGSDGKIGVTVVLDRKGKEDLAKHFDVGVKEVNDAITEVLAENEDAGYLAVE